MKRTLPAVYTRSLFFTLLLAVLSVTAHAQFGIINTIAGTGTGSYTGDGGPALSATLNNPTGMCVEAVTGNVYIADKSNNVIRKLTVATGIITTVAGTGASGYTGDGGAATSATLHNPTSVVEDASGNLYIADFSNNAIRKVSGGTISTIAGTGTAGFSGDGAAATSAELDNPYGVWVEASGNVLFTDQGNVRVRKIDASTGFISTIAGTGTIGFCCDGSLATAATFSHPSGICEDPSGVIYFCTQGGNARVRYIDLSGYIHTEVGNGTPGYSGDCDSATLAEIKTPEGVISDASGNIYLATTGDYRIRLIEAATGIVHTVAGDGATSYSGSGISPLSAGMDPLGVTIDASGNIYISGDNRIRKVTLNSHIDTVNLCYGDSVLLGSTTSYADSVRWSTGATTPSITVGTAGTYILTAHLCSYVDVDTIIVREITPMVHLGDDTTICAGAAIAIGSSDMYATGTTFLWSTGSTLDSITVDTTGMYTLMVTYGGCSDTDTVGITVAAPVLVHLGADTAICTGGTLTLSSSVTYAGAHYLWSTGDTTASINVSAAATYWLQVTYNGCMGRDSVVVMLKPLPVVTVGSNSPVCSGAGNAILLTATPSTAGETFSWTGPNGFTSGLQNPTIPSAVMLDSGIYKVVTTLSGCTDSASGNVIVNPTPATPVAGSNSPLCSGDTLKLTATDAAAGVSYAWAGPASYFSTAQNPKIFPVPASATGNYSVTATLAGCTSAAAVTNVSISPTPVITGVASNTPVCTGNELDLSATVTGSGTFTWQGPGGYTAGGATPAILHAALTNAGTYTVTVTTINGCKASATTSVVIKQTPPAPATENISYCQYDSAATLTAGGVSLLWYTAFTGGIGNPVAPTPSTNTSYESTYFVTQTVNGCESGRSLLQVNVYYKPLVTVQASKSFACLHDTTTFIYAGTPDAATLASVGAQYNWSLPAGTTIISGSASGPGPLTIKFDSSGADELVILTVSDGGNGKLCTGADTAHVRIIQTPYLGVYTKPAACAGDTVVVSLSSMSNNAYTYIWNFDGGTVVAANSNTSGPYKVVWNTPGLHTITASTETIEGCRSQDVPDTINIEPLPEARISVVNEPASVCTGDSLEFKTDFINNGYAYIWTPAQDFNVNNLPDIFGTIKLPGYITLTVKNEFGCRSADSTLIDAQPCCNVFFPTAFTPNNDGMNDVFRPVMVGHHTIHSFRIVDRWGQLMYNSDDDRASWNGVANGVPQDMGVYYYFIRFDCNGNIIEQKGEVTLVR